MINFKPVILGTDINAYGVARSFYEAYGVKSLCLGQRPLQDTRYSHIVEVQTQEDFQEEDVFLAVLEEVGRRYTCPLLLITSGDDYTALVTRHREALLKRYLLNYIDSDMQKRLENKKDFYAVCKEYGLDFPDTFVLTYDQRDFFKTPFGFPMALKPNDSIAYLHAAFPGKKKAYRIANEEELRSVVQSIYSSSYKGDLILQDYIPGDFSRMFVLNAYVNTKGEVKMMCLGKCLLDACLPQEIGNYNALISMGNDAIYAKYERFLKDIGYRGLANFDLKYDVRDGKYKVFEINIRQGRSSTYMTAGGCNFTTFLVEDLLLHEDKPTHYHKDSALWLYVDPQVLRTYCAKEDRDLVERYLAKGGFFPSWYEKDRSLGRFLLYWRRRLSTRRYYPKFQPQRTEQ